MPPYVYTRTSTFMDHKGVRDYAADEIGYIIIVEDKCMMGCKEEWLATDITPRLKKQLKNLDPAVFKVMKKGFFVNHKIYPIIDYHFTEHILKSVSRRCRSGKRLEKTGRAISFVC